MHLRIASHLLFLCFMTAASAQEANSPPYESQLLKLAETLGSLHYLSNLCGGKTPVWRDKMNMLLTTEKVDTARRKVLIAGFNNSYRSFADNYNQCTEQALKAIQRFKTQGDKITEGLIAKYGN